MAGRFPIILPADMEEVQDLSSAHWMSERLQGKLAISYDHACMYYSGLGLVI